MSNRPLAYVLSIGFNAKSGYTPAKGDVVELTGVFEVGLASNGSVAVVGEVDAIDTTQTKKVIVRTPFTHLRTFKSNAAISAVGAVCMAGSNKVRTWVQGTDKSEAVIGYALETAGGADVDVHVLMY